MNQTIENFIKKQIINYQNKSFNLDKFKKDISKRFNIPAIPNSEIIKIYKSLIKRNLIPKNKFLEKILKKRPIRSLSGVAVVSVLTKPYPCPGRCLYCPLEKGIPKSYLSGEPAVERAKSLNYHPFWQVFKRIETLSDNGHPTDKIELIVIGGTWSALPRQYQTWYIKECFRAANQSKIKNQSLKELQKRNEKAKHRIVGLTLETRPDWINPKEIYRMRKLGATRVELGVQSLDEEVLALNLRGHKVDAVAQAFKLLRDAGFKICAHMMPNLYGSTVKKDLKSFYLLFNDKRFKPDMLKIYPTMVIQESRLYNLYKKKKYRPYDDKTLINLLIKIKSMTPEFIRINRVIRDIPASRISGGSKISNLREVVLEEMKKRNLSCRCIRCREVRDRQIKKVELKIKDYQTLGGKEIFLSFVNQDRLAAFCRLRLPYDQNKELVKLMPEIKRSALIRELHTYGQLVPIGDFSLNGYQHQGLGSKLMKTAEEIAKKNGYSKMAVISGVGVRGYYRKLGYRLKGNYMVKKL